MIQLQIALILRSGYRNNYAASQRTDTDIRLIRLIRLIRSSDTKKSKTGPIGPALDRGYAKVWSGDLPPPNCLIINVLHSNSIGFLVEGAKLRKNLFPISFFTRISKNISRNRRFDEVNYQK